MLGRIAAFELRYQIRSPLALSVMAFFFISAFVDMAVAKMMTSAGGNVLHNSPHSIIMSHVVVSLLFLFVGAAFVSNVILRDDQTGFGPIIRSTHISKAEYLFGRFLGAFALGALIFAAIPLGAFVGTLMPFADQEMLGPNRLSGFAYGYGLIALPNALIISAFLFALATMTRSTAGTFIGVVGFFFLYLFSQRLMEGETQLQSWRVLADPLGATAYLASARYFTAAELNAGIVPISDWMIWSRLLWCGAAIAVLLLTYHRFRFAERGMSRAQKRRDEAPTNAPSRATLGRLPQPRFDRRAAITQFAARAGLEARTILRSPAFLILLLMAFAIAFPALLTGTGFVGVALYPLTSNTIPLIDEIFSTALIVIAAYYGGELVWRDRERRTYEIIDATPLPAWALMLPKVIGLTLILFTVLLVGVASGLLAQLLEGVEPALDKYLLWYLLPEALDAVVIAALAVFVQVVSPNKYSGWGVMGAYILLKIFGPGMGLEFPLLIYGGVPSGPLFDMSGSGNQAEASWWFRLFWSAFAILLLIAVHLLWPRGNDHRLRLRLGRAASRLWGSAGLVAATAATVLILSGSWIVYNSLVLNSFMTSNDTEAYFAEYERRYFRFASLPQPVVKDLELDVALYPQDVRAEVRGRYRLVNETDAPLDEVHVRLLSPGLELVGINFPGARVVHDDAKLGYRIYRLDAAMRPGEARTLAFQTRRQQHGFRAAGTESKILPNGTNLNSIDLTPRIGMSDVGLIDEPAARRRHGLPAKQPFPRLGDIAATRVTPSGDVSWTTSSITVSTLADQTPIAPGKLVSERVQNGRRTARFVSTMPISNFLSIQSGRYSVKRQVHGGIEYAVYHHPAHGWNAERMMTAMRASIDYYSKAFGPYQFDQVRIVERPVEGGGQAFPNTLAVSEGIFALDLRDPEELDMVTMLTAHELAHQWWGHQVRPARMQGGSLLGETLSQYSALMVLKRLRGEQDIRRFMQFQVDRYLSGRLTEVLDEQPLISGGIDQDHINYGKGAIALYLLQQRMGEQAVNRALRRFVSRYRFTSAPYPRSLDLIRMLRDEAKTPTQQALITDLFERITLYDLRVDQPRAVKRADGRWNVTVPIEARKMYADPRGNERPAPLNEPIEVGLFTKEPGSAGFGRQHVVRLEPRPIRSGRQVLRFVSDRKPTHAGIDPYNLYIDRASLDNVGAVAS